MIRIHIVTALAEAPTVESALSTLLGEPWEGTMRRDGGGRPGGPVVPSPYPGAAWCSGQWSPRAANRVTAEVMRVAPTAAIGRGAVLGVDDPDDELDPGDVSTEPDEPESLDRVYARWSAAHPELVAAASVSASAKV